MQHSSFIINKRATNHYNINIMCNLFINKHLVFWGEGSTILGVEGLLLSLHLVIISGELSKPYGILNSINSYL